MQAVHFADDAGVSCKECGEDGDEVIKSVNQWKVHSRRNHKYTICFGGRDTRESSLKGALDCGQLFGEQEENRHDHDDDFILVPGHNRDLQESIRIQFMEPP